MFRGHRPAAGLLLGASLFASVLAGGIAGLAAAAADPPKGGDAARPGDPARTAVSNPASGSAAAFNLSDPLPVDGNVKIGRLANGLTYYIRRNGWPEKRAALRLAINAGSVLEEDDQQGAAHILEHMQFNGSEHFKPGELVRYLESIGSRFGPDLNAYTSFDQTVYILDVPTDRDTLLDRGVLVMSDYAARATLSDTEIEKERGVVLEEWRLGQGADERMRRKQYPVIYHGSRYAQRLPIGLPEEIQHMPAERIRDFYRKWYRPENMAMIVVGDVDPARVEALIREHFGDIPASSSVTAVPTYDIPPHPETLYSVASDPEARYSTVQVVYKSPRQPEKTVGDYRQQLVLSLISAMLADRLNEIAKTPDAPFIAGYGSFGDLGRTLDTFNLYARATDGGIGKALKALLVEAEQVRRFGFGAAELSRAKQDLKASYERMYKEKDKTENGNFAREYVANFLIGEPIPGLDNEYQYMETLVPGITLDEVQATIKGWIHDDNRVIVASAPEKAGVTAPTPDELKAAVAEAAATPVTAWVDQTPDRPLMATKPEPGKITGRRTIDAIGVTVLTLSNGMQVWLKPTDFKHDQILVAAMASGGASTVEPKEYLEARYATAVVGESGIGGFKPVEMDKLLAGKLVGGSPYVNNYSQGFSGSSTPEDLETALQLTYLTFTQPTVRPEAYQVLKTRMKSDVANRAEDPDAVFSDSLQAVNFNSHYMVRAVTPGQIDSLDMARSVEIYRRLFANAADFTFLIVGAFDPKQIEPLVEQYLASLPSTGKATSAFVDRGYRFAGATRKLEVRKGLEPKSRTVLTFFANPGRDEMEIYRLNTAIRILNIRLRDLLREELGATYSVSAGFAQSQPWLDLGLVSISFGSSPENVGRMVDATLKEIERLKTEGPSTADLQKVQEMERRGLEQSEKQNGYWLSTIQMANRMGWDPAGIAAYRDRIDKVTLEEVRDSYRKYFPLERYTQVTLMPEKGSEATPGANR